MTKFTKNIYPQISLLLRQLADSEGQAQFAQIKNEKKPACKPKLEERRFVISTPTSLKLRRTSVRGLEEVGSKE